MTASVTVVILAAKYLFIRQQTILSQLNDLNNLISLNMLNSKKQNSISKLQLYWNRYSCLNKSTIHICRDTKAYSDFCSPLLTSVSSKLF